MNKPVDISDYAPNSRPLIKVLIIDDEPKVRKALHTLLNLSDYGVDIIGEAETGIQGLKLMEDLEPDLIFLDIVMPVMDGLEVLAHLQRKQVYKHIIIVSGFDDFNYAKQAISFNVIDYILKPFDLEDVECAMKKTVERMNLQKTMMAMESTLTRNKKESLLRRQDLIKQKIYEGKALTTEEKLELPAFSEKNLWQVHIVVVQNYYASVSDRYHGDRELFSYIVCKFFGEMLDSYGYSYVIGSSSTYQHLVYWILVSPEAGQRVLMELVSSIKKVLKVDCFFLNKVEPVRGDRVSSSIHKLEEVIVHTHLNYLNIDHKTVICKESKPTPELLISQISELTRKINYIVKHAQKNRVENIVGELFERWENQGALTCHFLFLAYSSIANISPEGDLSDNSPIDSFNFGLKMKFNVESIRSYFIHLIVEKINIQHKGELDASGDRIGLVKAYIDVHYAEPLSLNSLAHQFYISKEYLANRFKSKFTMTVHQYLHGIRLRKSLVLLMDRQYRISDVALMVGYDNFSYFNKLFRKEYGLTPSEYRDKQ
ncbi:Two-component response regulator, YesN/AraC family, consists of REC and AraC-type DNA-binding domains [Paenibacillus sp. 1_12]|uniref:response regulator transcription factor n=1 Tax=Paenibacillus sp. 1_12 TaxID=1566278 RepID=UPI0008F0F5BB|nr:response regulator [Paenibacillus sp. 1_12]SFM27385.1 Two-component response regulator, YesN/AraC family, consists of REC and AraC-type DNA-binding domains [Paenibacillus sp. 1_12]